MAVDSTCTFSQATPKRPGEADILNGTKENYPPNAVTPPQMPDAAEFMQMARQLVQLAKMTETIRISITGGASPTVHSFACVRDDVLTADITVTRNSAGNLSITWPANKFPASNTKPVVSLNTGAAGNLAPDAVLIANGVQVLTKNSAGAATDLSFTVQVF